MSYILEALRKSDKQRQRITAPTLLTAQSVAVAPKQSPVWKYVLVGVLLVGAGIAIGWLRPWQTEPVAAPVAAAKLPVPVPSQATAAAQPAPAEFAKKQEPPTQKSTAAAAPAPVPTSALIKQEFAAPAPRKETRRKQAKAIAVAPKKAATPTPQQPAPAQEQRVVAMSELPVQIQQEIPSMTISVHAYSSEPRNRLVDINDHLLREGMTVAPGLKLEEITPYGMIFSYKGYRFSRSARH